VDMRLAAEQVGVRVEVVHDHLVDAGFGFRNAVAFRPVALSLVFRQLATAGACTARPPQRGSSFQLVRGLSDMGISQSDMITQRDAAGRAGRIKEVRRNPVAG
jgi:hypothetical protein